jgi:hypothetical protein
MPEALEQENECCSSVKNEMFGEQPTFLTGIAAPLLAGKYPSGWGITPHCLVELAVDMLAAGSCRCGANIASLPAT